MYLYFSDKLRVFGANVAFWIVRFDSPVPGVPFKVSRDFHIRVRARAIRASQRVCECKV
jgi:hypothetical protein